jgi:stage III sporulation protein AG
MGKIMEWLKLQEKENKNIIYNIMFFIGIGVLLIILGDTVFNNVPKKIIDKKDNLVINEGNLKEQNKNFEDAMEERLEAIFSKMEGVGKVEVMLTISYGKEIFLAEDVDSNYSKTNEEDTQGGQREITSEDIQSKTVMQNTGSGSTEPVILKEKYPEVKGVLILAEGGEDPRVKQQLTAAAETLLGVPAHKVQVFKMNNRGNRICLY